MGKLDDSVGRYVTCDVGGEDQRIFFEEAGQGVPLILLHTAGADSRQWRHLLADRDVTSRFRCIAFDMPWHGRSLPPGEWWLTKYELTTDNYLATIRAFWLALELDRPIVMGCSMGGIVAPQIARHFQDELTGIIGLETSLTLKGRYNEFLHHPAVHGGEMVATYTLGLNGPGADEHGKRENWWYYAQGGPGVYQGDTVFGANYDGTGQLGAIDTRKCKVSLLTGEYDYSATPAMSKLVADEIDGARFTIMENMGHFPPVENYALFKKFLMPELEYMLAGRD